MHEDGSVWFDLTDRVKEYNDYLIRNNYGGNDGIHKIIYDDAKRTEKN